MAWGYTETEMDPVLRSEILLETARAEARIAIFAILVAMFMGAYLNFVGSAFRWLAIYVLIVVVPLIVDSVLRRQASRTLLGRVGPQIR